MFATALCLQQTRLACRTFVIVFSSSNTFLKLHNFPWSRVKWGNFSVFLGEPVIFSTGQPSGNFSLFTSDDGNELIFPNCMFAKKKLMLSKKTCNIYGTERIQQQVYKYSYVWDGENFHPDSWDGMPADMWFVVVSDEAESGHTSLESSSPQGFEQRIQTQNKCKRVTFTCNLLVNHKIDNNRPLVGGSDPIHHGVRSSFVVYTCGWKKEQGKVTSDELPYHPVLVFIFLLSSTDG